MGLIAVEIERDGVRFVNVKELNSKTSEVLHSTEDGRDVFVTFRGKPKFVIHCLGDDLEDYILANHPYYVEKAEQAWKEHLSGESVDIDTAIREAERAVAQVQGRAKQDRKKGRKASRAKRLAGSPAAAENT